MNWLNDYVKPKLNKLVARADNVADNSWFKDPNSDELVHRSTMEDNLWVFPSGKHYRISARLRLDYLFDDADYQLLDVDNPAEDPLKFKDSKRYTDKLKDARHKHNQDDTILVAYGMIDGAWVTAAVFDFYFMGGSMGAHAGSAIVKAAQHAQSNNCPLLIFTASGGARMQEGIISLMQLPRTVAAIENFKDATHKPFFVIHCDPTTGGVSASFAMLGDIHIAEPGAMIGFAGKRVIEQTVRQQLPDDFQTAEYLEQHGMVDLVVHRHKLKPTISRLCKHFTH